MDELDHTQYQQVARRSVRIVQISSRLQLPPIIKDQQDDSPANSLTKLFTKRPAARARPKKRRRLLSDTLGEPDTAGAAAGVASCDDEHELEPEVSSSLLTTETALFRDFDVAHLLREDSKFEEVISGEGSEEIGTAKSEQDGREHPLSPLRVEHAHDRSAVAREEDSVVGKEANDRGEGVGDDGGGCLVDHNEGWTVRSYAPAPGDTAMEIEEEESAQAEIRSEQENGTQKTSFDEGDAMTSQVQEPGNVDCPTTPPTTRLSPRSPPPLERSNRSRKRPIKFMDTTYSELTTTPTPSLPRAKGKNVLKSKSSNGGPQSLRKRTKVEISKPRPKIRKPDTRGRKDQYSAERRRLVVCLRVKPPAVPMNLIRPSAPDPRLIELSRKLTRRLPIDEKPEPCGQPDVWADSRQALCETVPYFKTPQGGCHSNDGHIYAFYFDGDGGDGMNSRREYMDTDVIIARARGGMSVDRTGNVAQCRDHVFSSLGSLADASAGMRAKGGLSRWSQPESMLNNIRNQNPVVVICGDRHTGAICRIPRKFCVLGWFKPIAVWTEKTLGRGGKPFRTIKYRLERLRSREPWFAPELSVQTDSEPDTTNLTPAERDLAGPVVRACCRACRNEWPRIYLVGWMCLQHDCPRLWRLSDGREADAGAQDYDPAFLLCRTAWSNEAEPYDVRVPVPTVGDHIGDNLAYINTRGVICPKCGRCNSRRLFKGWQCENPRCDWKRFPRHFPVRPAQLHSPWETFGSGPTLGRNVFDEAHVRLEVDHRLGYKIYRYTFAGVEGSLTHIASNAHINGLSDGPDDMLAALQQQDDPSLEMPLERRIFAGTGGALNADNSKLQIAHTEILQEHTDKPTVATTEQVEHDDGDKPKNSELPKDNISPTLNSTSFQAGDLMSAFSINYGMPYKFVASGASLPFDAAPWPVRHARASLNWASINLVPPVGADDRQDQDFNEQLIFAYLEKQKLDYHDDGEAGLGSRIATLSLGASARMHVRLKRKHAVGCSKSGVLTAERPLPGGNGGAAMDIARQAAWTEIEALPPGPERQRRRRELPRELGIFPERRPSSDAAGSANTAQVDRVILTLNHGDMVIMAGRALQTYFEHKVQSTGYLRFALTCRTVLPGHLTADERPEYDVPPDRETVGALMRLAEETARRERADGTQEELPEAPGQTGEVLASVRVDSEVGNA